MKKKSLLAICLVTVLVLSLVGACAAPVPAPAPAPAPAPVPAPAPAPTPKPAPAPAPAPKPTPAPVPKPAPEPVKKYHFKFSTAYAPPPDVHGVMMLGFFDEVTRLSEGQITFTTYWGGALGGVSEHLSLIANRTADLGKVPLGANPKELPLGCWEHATPFCPAEDIETCAIVSGKMVYEKFPIIEEQYRKQNLKHLFRYPWGPMDIMSTVPIRTLDDLKGTRVMIWGHWYPKQIEPITSVMSVPAYERYMNLKLGVAEVDCVPMCSFQTYKSYEVAKYFTHIGIGGHMVSGNVMNLDAWNELTPELQKLMHDVGIQKGIIEHSVNLRAFELEQYELFKARGVEFFTLSDEDRLEWANLLPDLGAEWATQIEKLGYPGWDIINYWQDACEDRGHEWIRRWAVR